MQRRIGDQEEVLQQLQGELELVDARRVRRGKGEGQGVDGVSVLS